jgi:hypothetical protein
MQQIEFEGASRHLLKRLLCRRNDEHQRKLLVVNRNGLRAFSPELLEGHGRILTEATAELGKTGCSLPIFSASKPVDHCREPPNVTAASAAAAVRTAAMSDSPFPNTSENNVVNEGSTHSNGPEAGTNHTRSIRPGLRITAARRRDSEPSASIFARSAVHLSLYFSNSSEYTGWYNGYTSLIPTFHRAIDSLRKQLAGSGVAKGQRHGRGACAPAPVVTSMQTGPVQAWRGEVE